MNRTKPIREKPHRLARQSYQGEVTVSITMCVEGRGKLFTNPEVVKLFVDMLQGSAARGYSLVLAYCFMPDHLHTILHGRGPETDLWRTAVDFKQRSGYWLSRHMPAVTWQKDFHDHVLRHRDDVIAHIRYVLDNPCRKGLVANWEEYPYKGAIGCALEEVLDGLVL